MNKAKTLVRTIAAVERPKPPGPVERMISWVLLKAYRRRLRAIVASAPAWVSEQILSASEEIDDDRAVLWVSEN